MFSTRVGGGLCIHMCAGRPSAVTIHQAHVMDRQAKILTLTLILEQYVDKERGLAGEAPAAARIETPTSKRYTYVNLRSDNGKRTCNEDLESKHIGALWQDTNLEETYCTNLNALTHRSIRLARRILKRRMTHKPCASIRRAVKRLQ
jgi:hypothetical protein